MDLWNVLWVYKIALLALIKLWLQHKWLFAICGIHLCTFWRVWECLQKDSRITSRDSYTENCLLSNTGFHLLLTFWSFHGFFMPEPWFWEWEGTNISVTEVSYCKETFLFPNQNILLNKLAYSENNNSMVQTNQPTHKTIKWRAGQARCTEYLSVVWLSFNCIHWDAEMKGGEGMCFLKASSRTEESFAKQQFAQRLSGNREGHALPPRTGIFSSQPSTLQQQSVKGIKRSWVLNIKLNSPVLSDTHGEESQVFKISWSRTYQTITASFYSPTSRGGNWKLYVLWNVLLCYWCLAFFNAFSLYVPSSV